MATVVTVDEVLAIANGNTGRLRVIADGILDILETNLPAVLAAVGLPAINGWFWAGEPVGEDNFPAMVVAWSVTSEPHGTGYTSVAHLVCSYVQPTPLSRRGRQISADVADLARALLFHPQFNGPYAATQGGPMLWHALIPRGVQPLPPNPDRDYDGMGAHFEAVQHASGPSTNPYWVRS